MEYSTYQKNIFEAIAKTEDSLLIEARAGASKTTTIIAGLSYISSSKKVLMVAFNKNIVEALKSKVNLPNVIINTYHALGFSAYRNYMGYNNPIKVDQYKVLNIFKSYIKEGMTKTYNYDEVEKNGDVKKLSYVANLYNLFKNPILELVSLAKQNGMFVTLEDKPETWLELVDFYDVNLDVPFNNDIYKQMMKDVIAYAMVIMVASNDQDQVIDFDDMIYLPLLHELKLDKPFDVIFIDEAQDLNITKLELTKLFLANRGRVIAVGDPNQCHPADTLIRVKENGVLKTVCIEYLKEGDYIQSYTSNRCGYPFRRVESIKVRSYENVMLNLVCGSSEVKVTPNHKCLVRITNKKGYILYLAAGKSSYVKVGIYKHTGSLQGLVKEFKDRKMQRLWLLAFNENLDYIANEVVKLQTTYGLFKINNAVPENEWVSMGLNSYLSEEDLDKLLAEFKRDVCFPFLDVSEPGEELIHLFRADKYISYVLEACHLINGLFKMLSIKDGWQPVIVEPYLFKGEVYSIKIETKTKPLYVANDIVVGNSIYGFCGAHADAMNKIKEAFNCKELPLSICYRCSKKVVKEAQKYVPSIEAWDQSPEGSVVDYGTKWGTTLLKPTDVILCRNNYPLIKLAYALLKAKIPCTIVGRDFGIGLTALVKKFKGCKTIGQLQQDLQNHFLQAKEEYILKKKGNIESLHDKVESLFALMSDFTPLTAVKTLLNLLDTLFNSEKKGITLSSIHKAKGLEWERVFILDRDLIPSKYANLEWQRQQEFNLLYVAITRAGKDLFYISIPKKEKND